MRVYIRPIVAESPRGARRSRHDSSASNGAPGSGSMANATFRNNAKLRIDRRGQIRLACCALLGRYLISLLRARGRGERRIGFPPSHRGSLLTHVDRPSGRKDSRARARSYLIAAIAGISNSAPPSSLAGSPGSAFPMPCDNAG